VTALLGPDQAVSSIEHVDARWLAMLLVVLTTADVAGFVVGIVTAAVAAAAIDLWIVGHGSSGVVPQAHDAVALALFVIASITGCALITRLRPAVPAPSGLIAPQRHPEIEPITERELGVLELLNMGLSNDDIARHLVVSTNTVKSHLEHLYGKLGVSSRGRAVAEAHRRGLIGPVDRE
jgi:DNA-binding NarL/FixJ family response regulator